MLLIVGQAAGVEPWPVGTAAEERDPPAELSLADDLVVLLAAGRTYAEAGRYGPAAEVLFQAVAVDPGSAEAHLLLARVLAHVRKNQPGDVCSWWAFQDDIEKHLAEAVRLQPDLRVALPTDPAYEELRDALYNSTWLAELGGESRGKQRAAELLVVRTHWVRAKDRWFSDAELDLRADETATWTWRRIGEGGAVKREGQPGTWRWKRKAVWLDLGEGPQPLRMTEERELDGGEVYGVFRDRPADCEVMPLDQDLLK